ncbi:MAG: hypothetical protein ACWA6X_13985 [Bauldia sp.]
MSDARTRDTPGLPGTQRGPAQPIPDEAGGQEKPSRVPPPDLIDDTDGDVAPKDRPKLPLSSEEAFGESSDD